MVLSRLLGVVLLLVAGCFDPTTNTCADGALCPDGLACFQVGAEPSQCVRAELLAACTGENLVCNPASGGEGTCQQGLCVIGICGNCKIEGDEVCDDGNQVSGDGCRSDCLAATWSTSRRDLGEAVLNRPHSLSADAEGTLFIADEHRLRKVDAEGVVTTLAGREEAGFAGDDGPATGATLNLPRGIAVDNAGKLFISDTGNDRLRTIDTSGIITTMAGVSVAVPNGNDFADGASPLFRQPSGLFHEAVSETLLIADAGNHVVRRYDLSTGSASTFIGKPETLGVNLIDANEDGQITADEARLFLPRAVVRCPSGDWYVADTGNNRVLRIVATGCDPVQPDTCVVTTVLGDTEPASSGEGFPSDIFPVHAPEGLHCDSQNNLFVTSTTTVRLVLSRDHDGDPSTPPVVDGRGNVQSILARDALPEEGFPCESDNGGVFGLSGIAGKDDDTVWVSDSCTGSLFELTRPARESSCAQ